MNGRTKDRQEPQIAYLQNDILSFDWEMSSPVLFAALPIPLSVTSDKKSEPLRSPDCNGQGFSNKGAVLVATS